MTSKLPSYPKEFLEISFSENEYNENVSSEEVEIPKTLPFADSDTFNSSLKSAAYLTHGIDVKTVISICLDIQGSGIEYRPGDTFGILPQNNNGEVNELIDRLNYAAAADKKYTLRIKENEGKKKIPAHVPTQSTIRKVLLNNLDIRCVPKKTFLRALSKYTTDENEVEQINEISSKNYMKFINEGSYTLLDLLKRYSTCSPPFNVLLEHLPRLLPRPYSVACSPYSVKPFCSELKFVFSLSHIPNSLEGVCTGWLNNKVKHLETTNSNSSDTNSVTVPLYRRKANSFHLPEQVGTSIVMVCAGTGIAPFIGFLQHLEIQQTNRTLTDPGRVWLFYGCRFSDRDFLFKSELEHFLNVGVLSKLFVAFSRENGEVKYVQDNIKKNAVEFVGMLDGGVTYVCGGANMSKGVLEVVVECLMDVKYLSKLDAVQYVDNLKKQSRYIEDVWS